MKIKQLVFLIAIVSFLLTVSCRVNCGENVKIIQKPITTPGDIIPITDSVVIPYVYTSAVSLKSLPVEEKKQKFFDMMLPAVLVAKENIDIDYRRVKMISELPKMTYSDSLFIDTLMKRYKSPNIEVLKSRLVTFPVSIVLAQAAIESAWGTSRFFIEAENPFGLWSFDPNEDRIPAESTRDGKKIYLRKFPNLEQAIEAYFTTLATGPFKDFRKAKLKTQNPYELVVHLMDYSERREAYVEEVSSVMRVNNLTKYDSYHIAPQYINQCD